MGVRGGKDVPSVTEVVAIVLCLLGLLLSVGSGVAWFLMFW